MGTECAEFSGSSSLRRNNTSPSEKLAGLDTLKFEVGEPSAESFGSDWVPRLEWGDTYRRRARVIICHVLWDIWSAAVYQKSSLLNFRVHHHHCTRNFFFPLRADLILLAPPPFWHLFLKCNLIPSWNFWMFRWGSRLALYFKHFSGSSIYMPFLRVPRLLSITRAGLPVQSLLSSFRSCLGPVLQLLHVPTTQTFHSTLSHENTLSDVYI